MAGAPRGGKGGFEPRVRVRQREADVVQLAVQGRTQHDIARALGISQAAVSKILRRVDDRWEADNTDRLRRYRAEQARRLEHLYREGMAAWERSKAQRTRRRQRKADGESSGIAEVIVDDSHGDPRFLEAARKALADLAQISGASASPRASTDSDEPFLVTLKLGDERTAPKAALTSKENSDETTPDV